MTVDKQSFVQPPGPRNPNPVTVTNVIATLHGTQPESANRIYLVSGHLDTRCTDVLDFQCDAPGADDDGDRFRRRLAEMDGPQLGHELTPQVRPAGCEQFCWHP
jgi:hypothetical protein